MIPFLSGFGIKALSRLGVIAGVAIALWFAWNHYEGLLDDRAAKEILESDLQFSQSVIDRQSKSILKSERSYQELQDDYAHLDHQLSAYRARTEILEAENETYRNWRAAPIDPIADKRLREHTEATRQRLRRKSTGTPDRD